MVQTKGQREGQRGGVAGLLRGKMGRAIVSVVSATVLTLSMIAPAWALDGPIQDRTSGTGTTADPYIIAVSASDFTRPSAFWSGMGTNAVSGGQGVGTFAVVFDSSSTNYNSKMFFDMSAGLNGGVAEYGPWYVGSGMSGEPGSYIGSPTGIASARANVWDGNWTYAFRLCPYATFQDVDANGTMDKLAFNWKGCFATYFTNWTYSFNAASALGATAGQSVTLTYYGGYLADQTSRGTNYTASFDATTTDTTYGSGAYSTQDSPADVDGYSVSATVGSDGVVMFSGTSAINYGGNYTITVA